VSITEHLMRLGGGSVTLRPDTPPSITNKVRALVDDSSGGVGASVIFTDLRQPLSGLTDAMVHSAATFTGKITKLPDRTSIEFEGLGWWLDDTPNISISETAGGPDDWVTALAGNLTPGTCASTPTYSRTFPANTATRREMLNAAAAGGGWEYRIMPDGSIDASPTLFSTTPTVIVTKKSTGSTGSVRGISGGIVSQELDVSNLATRATAVTAGSGSSIVTGSATQAISLRNLAGGAPEIGLVLDAPSEAGGNASDVAAKFLALQEVRRSVRVSSLTHFLPQFVVPGDYVWVYDLAAGLFDTNNRINFEGQIINPVKVRLLSYSRPVEHGGVYIRPNAAVPEYLDLTDYVEFESGETSWEVGGWTPHFGAVNRSNPSIEGRATDTVGSVVISGSVAYNGASASGDGTLTSYGVTFAGTPVLVATVSQSGTGANNGYYVKIDSNSATQFKFRHYQTDGYWDDGVAGTINWIATGTLA